MATTYNSGLYPPVVDTWMPSFVGAPDTEDTEVIDNIESAKDDYQTKYSQYQTVENQRDEDIENVNDALAGIYTPPTTDGDYSTITGLAKEIFDSYQEYQEEIANSRDTSVNTSSFDGNIAYTYTDESGVSHTIDTITYYTKRDSEGNFKYTLWWISGVSDYANKTYAIAEEFTVDYGGKIYTENLCSDGTVSGVLTRSEYQKRLKEYLIELVINDKVPYTFNKDKTLISALNSNLDFLSVDSTDDEDTEEEEETKYYYYHYNGSENVIHQLLKKTTVDGKDTYYYNSHMVGSFFYYIEDTDEWYKTGSILGVIKKDTSSDIKVPFNETSEDLALGYILTSISTQIIDQQDLYVALDGLEVYNNKAIDTACSYTSTDEEITESSLDNLEKQVSIPYYEDGATPAEGEYPYVIEVTDEYRYVYGDELYIVGERENDTITFKGILPTAIEGTINADEYVYTRYNLNLIDYSDYYNPTTKRLRTANGFYAYEVSLGDIPIALVETKEFNSEGTEASKELYVTLERASVKEEVSEIDDSSYFTPTYEMITVKAEKEVYYSTCLYGGERFSSIDSLIDDLGEEAIPTIYEHTSLILVEDNIVNVYTDSINESKQYYFGKELIARDVVDEDSGDVTSTVYYDAQLYVQGIEDLEIDNTDDLNEIALVSIDDQSGLITTTNEEECSIRYFLPGYDVTEETTYDTLRSLTEKARALNLELSSYNSTQDKMKSKIDFYAQEFDRDYNRAVDKYSIDNIETYIDKFFELKDQLHEYLLKAMVMTVQYARNHGALSIEELTKEQVSTVQKVDKATKAQFDEFWVEVTGSNSYESTGSSSDCFTKQIATLLSFFIKNYTASDEIVTDTSASMTKINSLISALNSFQDLQTFDQELTMTENDLKEFSQQVYAVFADPGIKQLTKRYTEENITYTYKAKTDSWSSSSEATEKISPTRRELTDNSGNALASFTVNGNSSYANWNAYAKAVKLDTGKTYTAVKRYWTYPQLRIAYQYGVRYLITLSPRSSINLEVPYSVKRIMEESSICYQYKNYKPFWSEYSKHATEYYNKLFNLDSSSYITKESMLSELRSTQYSADDDVYLDNAPTMLKTLYKSTEILARTVQHIKQLHFMCRLENFRFDYGTPQVPQRLDNGLSPFDFYRYDYMVELYRQIYNLYDIVWALSGVKKANVITNEKYPTYNRQAMSKDFNHSLKQLLSLIGNGNSAKSNYQKVVYSLKDIQDELDEIAEKRDMLTGLRDIKDYYEKIKNYITVLSNDIRVADGTTLKKDVSNLSKAIAALNKLLDLKKNDIKSYSSYSTDEDGNTIQTITTVVQSDNYSESIIDEEYVDSTRAKWVQKDGTVSKANRYISTVTVKYPSSGAAATISNPEILEDTVYELQEEEIENWFANLRLAIENAHAHLETLDTGEDMPWASENRQYETIEEETKGVKGYFGYALNDEDDKSDLHIAYYNLLPEDDDSILDTIKDKLILMVNGEGGYSSEDELYADCASLYAMIYPPTEDSGYDYEVYNAYNEVLSALKDEIDDAYTAIEKAAGKYNYYCKVYFALSQYMDNSNIQNIQVIVNDYQTNKPVLDSKLYPYKIKISDLLIDADRQAEGRDDKYYVIVSAVDMEGSGFEIDTRYRVQLRITSNDATVSASGVYPVKWFSNNLDYFSEWSTVCLIRPISQPYLKMTSLDDSTTRGGGISIIQEILDFSGSLIFPGNDDQKDDPENLKFYSLLIYDEDGECVYKTDNIYTDENNPNKVYQNIRYLFTRGNKYNVACDYTTNNGYETQETWVFVVMTVDFEKLSGTLTATPEPEYGRIKIEMVSDSPYIGNVVIRRSDNSSSFILWDDIYYSTSYDTQNNYTLTWYDYTAKSGMWYNYSICKVTAAGIKGTATYIERPITLYLEDIFLIDSTLQVCVKDSPKVSNYKRNVSESKTDTLGSQYPFIRRNGKVDYRSFAISGTISSYWDNGNRDSVTAANIKLNDSLPTSGSASENDGLFLNRANIYGDYAQYYSDFNIINNISDNRDFIYEREFREKVIEFLTNGKAKLYKSTTEGNIIVKLMDVSFTPNTTVGRLVYDFSATAYEIDEYSVDKCDEYGIQSIGTYKNEISYDFYEPFMFSGVTYTNETDSPMEIYSPSGNTNNSIMESIRGKTSNTYNFSDTLKYLTYLKIHFESKPYLILVGDDNQLTKVDSIDDVDADDRKSLVYGYILIINGTNILVSPHGVYEVGNLNSGDDILISSIQIGGNCSETMTIDCVGQVSRKQDNSSVITRVNYRYVVGQISGEFETNNFDIIKNNIEERYEKEGNGYNTEFQKFIDVTIEAKEGTIVEVKDSKSSIARRHVIGPSGVLVLEKDEVNIDSIAFVSWEERIKTQFNNVPVDRSMSYYTEAVRSDKVPALITYVIRVLDTEYLSS